jgi:hypothetical protein
MAVLCRNPTVETRKNRQALQYLYGFSSKLLDENGIALHTQNMDFDIAHLLANWDYQPGQVVVRRFKGKDGLEKIQLRVDLGILQMNAEGRPDGKRPYGRASLFEHHQAKLYKYVAAHGGSDAGFVLKAEDCARLQLEWLQYHHRYICLLQIEDHEGVIRDAERNLEVLNFVALHAEAEELVWPLKQFQPQLLMILTRARATQALKVEDYGLAVARGGKGHRADPNVLQGIASARGGGTQRRNPFTRGMAGRDPRQTTTLKARETGTGASGCRPF